MGKIQIGQRGVGSKVFGGHRSKSERPVKLYTLVSAISGKIGIVVRPTGGDGRGRKDTAGIFMGDRND